MLYVRNLKSDVTEADLKEKFEVYGVVERVKRVKSYGFVHFAERNSAITAMEALNGIVSVSFISFLFAFSSDGQIDCIRYFSLLLSYVF